ncbi:hypothetical protein PLAN_10041 [Planktothrix rubescens CCAP 1459/22]|uniref:Uncharacterized protein n=1 Tax=Planktothrix rubescens CCAP 1459/22 TaxID=329571 RepID=A0A6J7ZFM8_PLARU|nr:hypothetical protein PLAN_10041 [Planktothrix rubescens NIVA-CYA 18]
MGNRDHGFKRISRILICVNLRNHLKSVMGFGEDIESLINELKSEIGLLYE